MTVAERLRHLAEMSEQDPADLWRIRWRLFTLIDFIDAEQKECDARLVDELCKLENAA